MDGDGGIKAMPVQVLPIEHQLAVAAAAWRKHNVKKHTRAARELEGTRMRAAETRILELGAEEDRGGLKVTSSLRSLLHPISPIASFGARP